MIGEHVELAQLTKRFAAALHNVAQDVELPRKWFETLARNYIAATRQHMATEEQRLFPRALATFSDADWAELDAHVLAGNDPLFGSPMERHYLDLHRRIMRAGS